MFGILKEELASYHGITLSAGDDPFSLDELQIALQKLVGDGAARWLMLEICAEIDFLKNEFRLNDGLTVENRTPS